MARDKLKKKLLLFEFYLVAYIIIIITVKSRMWNRLQLQKLTFEASVCWEDRQRDRAKKL